LLTTLISPVGIRAARTAFQVGIWLPMLAGCAATTGHVEPSSCQQINGHQVLEAELFFGRDVRGHGTVSDAQWSGFLHDEVAARFPDGLTVLTASGQWRDTDSGRTVEEPSFIVRLVTSDTPQTLAQLAQIRSAYMQRFQQQSVGLTLSSICASF
jgi:hypothetical protein